MKSGHLTNPDTFSYPNGVYIKEVPLYVSYIYFQYTISTATLRLWVGRHSMQLFRKVHNLSEYPSMRGTCSIRNHEMAR